MKPLTKYYSDDFCQALPWPRKAAVYLASQADTFIAEYQAIAIQASSQLQAERIRARELEAKLDAALQAVDDLRAERVEVAELEKAIDKWRCDYLVARNVLSSPQMQRVLSFVANHAGKGVNARLQLDADWIDSRIPSYRSNEND